MAVAELEVVAPPEWDSAERIQELDDVLIGQFKLLYLFYTPPVWEMKGDELICVCRPIKQDKTGAWPLRFTRLNKKGQLQVWKLNLIKKELRRRGFTIVYQKFEGNNLPKRKRKRKLACAVEC